MAVDLIPPVPEILPAHLSGKVYVNGVQTATYKDTGQYYKLIVVPTRLVTIGQNDIQVVSDNGQAEDSITVYLDAPE